MSSIDPHIAIRNVLSLWEETHSVSEIVQKLERKYHRAISRNDVEQILEDYKDLLDC